MHSAFFWIAFINLLVLKQIGAPSTSGVSVATKIQRTQSMRSHSRPTVNRERAPSRSSSSASMSSTASRGRESLTEVDLRPLAEGAKRVRIVEPVNLNEALESTQTGGRINPSRDGALSRLRSIGLRYGSAAAVGSAIGAGGSVFMKNFINNDNNRIETTTSIPVTTTSKKDVGDKIVNHI